MDSFHVTQSCSESGQTGKAQFYLKTPGSLAVPTHLRTSNKGTPYAM